MLVQSRTVRWGWRRGRRTCGALALAGLLGWAAGGGRAARADDAPLAPLRPVLTRFAAELAGFARERQIREVAVGQVTAPAVFRASASAGVEALLIQEIGQAGLRVSRTAETEVKGEYWLEEDAGDRPESLGLLLRVVRSRQGGAALREFSSRLDLAKLDPHRMRTIVAVMFGLNLEAPVTTLLTVRDAQRELRDAVGEVRKPEDDAPPPDEAAVETEYVGRYGVRIEAKDRSGAYVTRPLTRQGPFLSVDLRPEESFRAVLVNETGDEAAGEVVIDGISVLEFSKNPKRRFLVAPDSSLEVEGWISAGDDRLHEFRVKDFGESVFAAAGRSNHGDLGMITVRFARCFPSRPKGNGAAELPAHAIGRGSEKPVTVEDHPRWIDQADAVVHVRYRITGSAADRAGLD